MAIRVLHLEDSRPDAALVEHALASGGLACELYRVDTRASYVTALEKHGFDIILSDYRLPDFDGLTALLMLRQRDPLVPFILVTGTMGEEAAVQSLLSGATDYILKDRLGRLASAVTRALDAAQDHRRRQEAETALRASEERYRSFVDTTWDWAWTCDVEGRLTFSNASATRLTGYALHELLGRSVRDFVPDGELSRFDDLYRRCVSEGSGTTGLVLPFLHRDGDIKQLEVSSAPIVAENGQLLGFSGTTRDITQRLALEAQLRQAQKMEALGSFAGGIAHDFNNLLTAVLGFSELLLADTTPQSSSRGDLEAIQHAAEHGAALTRQLLAFGRYQLVELTSVDLGVLVEEFERVLRLLAGDVALVVLRGEDAGAVNADRGQLQQVIMNLVVNARDAMPHGGTITVETRLATAAECVRVGAPGRVQSSAVVLVVSDTGCGMDASTRARIFEPFFTTKERGRGTGLGLSTVFGIVTQAGGQIELDSVVGHGTTFRVYLPCGEDPASDSAPLAAEPSHEAQTGTLLLVEDEAAIRELARRTLTRCGYEVLAAASAEAALQWALVHERPIDVLVTDLALPGMSGLELIDHMEGLRPGIRVLVASACCDEQFLRAPHKGEPRAFLQKPFGPAQLALKVRGLLMEAP